MNKDSLLTETEMKEAYGEFFNSSPGVHFEIGEVPEELRPLMAYAKFWGVSDDWQREGLVQKAPILFKENLKAIVRSWDDELDVWLAGSEAASPDPSDAYVAFSAMRMAADFA